MNKHVPQNSQSCDALTYTHNAAVTEAGLALECLNALPPGPYIDAFRTLTEYSTARLY